MDRRLTAWGLPSGAGGGGRGAKSKPMWPAERIVFLNDVFFCARDVVRLLQHDGDMVCGMDFDRPKLEEMPWEVRKTRPNTYTAFASVTAYLYRARESFFSQGGHASLEMTNCIKKGDKDALIARNGVHYAALDMNAVAVMHLYVRIASVRQLKFCTGLILLITLISGVLRRPQEVGLHQLNNKYHLNACLTVRVAEGAVRMCEQVQRQRFAEQLRRTWVPRWLGMALSRVGPLLTRWRDCPSVKAAFKVWVLLSALLFY